MIDDAAYSDLELQLRAVCETGFTVVPRNEARSSFSPIASVTGEGFTELVSPNSKPFPSDQEAYDEALAAFRSYAATRAGGTLYWRVYPEIDRGRFYMRLLISDKPPLHSVNK